jgi:hypothetical protein
MKMTVEIKCKTCGKTYKFEINPKGYVRWEEGTPIQVALPELTPSQRELMISQTCDTCFDTILKEL